MSALSPRKPPTNTLPRTSYYGDSTDLGLPAEEYRYLQRRFNRDRLNDHFRHSGSSNSSSAHSSRTSYQDAGIPSDDRVHISEVRNATHAALGAGFDFTDGSYSRATASRDRGRDRDHACRGRNTNPKSEEPIPQRYIDEFNRKWREVDDLYDSVQCRADFDADGQWRRHVPLEIDPSEMYVQKVARETPSPRNVARPRREEREVREHRAHLVLVSKFSFDSDVPPKKKGIFRTFR